MGMLFLKENRVVLSEGCMDISEVKTLYNRDKTETKKFFNDVLTYIYWVYSKDSVCANKYPEDRKKFVIANFLPSRNYKEFEEHKHVRELIVMYNDLEKTLTERFYDDLKGDMEEMLNYLRNIPWTKKIKIEKDVDVYVGGESHKVRVDANLDHDNSDTKVSALSKAEKLIDLEEKLKLKIFKEIKEKSGTRRKLFENA